MAQKGTNGQLNLIYRSIKQPSIQVASLMLLQFLWEQNVARSLSESACPGLQELELQGGHALSPVRNSVATLLPEYEPVVTGSEISPILMLEWERKKNRNQSIRDGNCIEMLSS